MQPLQVVGSFSAYVRNTKLNSQNSGGIAMYEKEAEQLQTIIDDSERIVIFGGAGVSTELSLIHI